MDPLPTACSKPKPSDNNVSLFLISTETEDDLKWCATLFAKYSGVSILGGILLKSRAIFTDSPIKYPAFIFLYPHHY